MSQVAPELKAGLSTVNHHITQAAEMVPESRYPERPARNLRSFLELVAHAADGNRYYCALAAGDPVDWTDAVERSAKSKDDAVRALKESLAACTVIVNRADAKTGPLIEYLAHANLHYGNMVVYLRLMGMTPPSSQ